MWLVTDGLFQSCSCFTCYRCYCCSLICKCPESILFPLQHYREVGLSDLSDHFKSGIGVVANELWAVNSSVGRIPGRKAGGGQLDYLAGSFSDSLADLFHLGASVKFPASPGHCSQKQSTEHADEFANMLGMSYVDSPG